MICWGFDEDKIERKLTEGVQALKGLHYDITLKDVVTVEHDLSRLPRWVDIARRVIDNVYGA